jgi:hypothetical protein
MEATCIWQLAVDFVLQSEDMNGCIGFCVFVVMMTSMLIDALIMISYSTDGMVV